MNEKKQSQQLTVSAHHQKRQQSLGVVSSNHANMIGVNNSHQIQINAANSAPGGSSAQMQALKSNNFMQQQPQLINATGMSGSSSSVADTNNRGGSTSGSVAFIRSSYASGSRMKKSAAANIGGGLVITDYDIVDSSQLDQPISSSVLLTSNHPANSSQLKSKRISNNSNNSNLSKKIKVMRNHAQGSGSGVSGGAPMNIPTSQHLALQIQLGTASNIITQQQQYSTLLRQNQPSSPKQSTVSGSNGSMAVHQITPQHQQLVQMQNQVQINQQQPPGTASLKSARRYQLMNSSQKQAQQPGTNASMVSININSSSGNGLMPTHTQLSPQNLSTQFANHFPAGIAPSNQTVNISQYKQGGGVGSQLFQSNSHQKGTYSLERPANHNNDLILQSPMSSDTNSINSLDQTLRVRIGGSLPMGLLNQNSSTGVHPNHFYQSSSLNREFNQSGVSNSGYPGGSGAQLNYQQQQLTNTSNFNSLDYSDTAGSSRRAYNESQNAQATHQSANVKRNNFLQILNGPAQQNYQNINEVPKSSEGGTSQQNPPTLRKISLNQRILQKNMARVTASSNPPNQNVQVPSQQLQDEHNIKPQFLNQQHFHDEQISGVQQQAQPIPMRHKKFQQNKAQFNATTNIKNLQLSSSNQRESSVATNNSEQQPMINVARIQQAIQKIYNNQRKNSIQQPNDASSSTQTIDQNGSQAKRKQIKLKQSFGAIGQSQQQVNAQQSTQMSINTQPTNASSDQQNKSGGNVPQLNLTNVSQETGSNIQTQQSATSPLNLKMIHQGQIASSSRRQMRETQRSQVNTTHQDTARNSMPINLVQNQQHQPQQELTNRSHLTQVTMSEPIVVTDHNMLAQQRESTTSKIMVSARVQERDPQIQHHKQLVHQTSTDSIHATEDLEFPISPAKAIKYLRNHLTAYELQEILDYPQIYYIGQGSQKIKGSQQVDHNFGYDDHKGNYKVILRDHIGYRYEVQQFLGKGSFGQAIKCFDHKRKECVALKVIKNKKKYYYQAGVELKILQFLKENDPDDTMNIIHMKDYVIFRKHLCISFELMSINLYDFLKLNDFEGLSLGLIRRFAIQLLYALKYLREHDVIHCDLKPENILLKDPTKSGIKIIDFGSSCFQDERVYTYIQSRFYRAPEIILGIPYTPAIDMWSFGCIMAEFCIGYPIFPGEDEMEQLAMMMEVCGVPNQQVLSTSTRRKKFFQDDGQPILIPNQRGKVRKPASKSIVEVLETDDKSFIDFISRCLEWSPETRMNPDEALRHAWILEGLPPKVLIHHQKLHNIPTMELPPHIREIRQQYLLKEQAATQQQSMMFMAPAGGQQLQQPQQYRSEPRKQQPSIIGSSGNNNSTVIKRSLNNQQQLMLTGSVPQGISNGLTNIVTQSDNHLQNQMNQQQLLSQTQQSNQTLSLLHQSLEGASAATVQALQNNLISPRTKKIVMNNSNNNSQQQQEAAQKNHLILKTSAANGAPMTTTNLENKSLENTLRNRKIVLHSGLKRAAHDQQQQLNINHNY